jgi:hypothetical protein
MPHPVPADHHIDHKDNYQYCDTVNDLSEKNIAKDFPGWFSHIHLQILRYQVPQLAILSGG